MQYQNVKDLVLTRLSLEIAETLSYHGVHHTRDVLGVCETRAKALGLPEDERTLLFTAAVMHDAGFLQGLHNHEKEGVKIAKEILPEFGYNASDINQIAGMILATKIPQLPKTKLERILCDADLDYLGRSDFYTIGFTLFLELKALGVISDRKEWDALQIKFLSNHQYHTDISIQLRAPQKQLRLEELKEKWSD